MRRNWVTVSRWLLLKVTSTMCALGKRIATNWLEIRRRRKADYKNCNEKKGRMCFDKQNNQKARVCNEARWREQFSKKLFTKYHYCASGSKMVPFCNVLTFFSHGRRTYSPKTIHSYNQFSACSKWKITPQPKLMHKRTNERTNERGKRTQDIEQ